MANEAFVPLRLPGSPIETHAQYIRLEDALNALGQQDYATEWGRLPGWSQMPFRWRPKSRAYVRHELRLFGQRARLQRVPVTLELTKVEKRACVQIYKGVRKIIREALEQSKLHPHAVHHATGDVTRIKAPCVWRKQTGPIFFTGRTVLREPDQADRIADVVLERKSFERWLGDRAKTQRKMATGAMLKKAHAVIAEHSRQHKYEIIRPEAKKLVMDIAREHGKKVSNTQFKEYVWKGLGGKAGRRTKAQQMRYKQYEMDLKEYLTVVFGAVPKT